MDEPINYNALTPTDYLRVARSFLWVVNEEAVYAAHQELPAVERHAVQDLNQLLTRLDEIIPAFDKLQLSGNFGLPPNEPVQKLASLILKQKGSGSVCIGASSFTCVDAK